MTAAAARKPALRHVSLLSELTKRDREQLLRRATQSDDSVRERTTGILQRVRLQGDFALREMALEYDGVALDALEVPASERRRALASLDAGVRSALQRAARNIAAVHSAAAPGQLETETEPGVIVGRRPDPLTSVGIYAPGGRASYASSVLMGAVPARVAGVTEIVLCSPPLGDGLPAAVVLAACEIAGVDRVFALGGAGAIGALAYGTETVPRVDIIAGPGNAYVSEAKLQVSRDVRIDSPAGPSELLIICDESCDARTVALEAVAQAEHDVDARVVTLCIGEGTAARIADAISADLAAAPESTVARISLGQNGAVLGAETCAEALAFAADFAPEHLLLCVREAEDLLPQIRNAGCVFIGEQSSVTFGDYLTGGNHVLPTGGLARSYSGLGPLDFVRWTYYQKVDRAAAGMLSNDTAILAAAEKLPAHARAALAWSLS